MARNFIPTPITVAQLTNRELRNGALGQAGNTTIETYRMTLDRSLQHESKCEEVLYIGNQRTAVVTWEGRALVCDDVDSAEQAFRRVLRYWEE